MEVQTLLGNTKITLTISKELLKRATGVADKKGNLSVQEYIRTVISESVEKEEKQEAQ